MAANYLTPRTLATSVIGLIALGILLFVPAGTLAYWQGWLFIIVFAASTQAIGIYLAFKDPALLARRMQAGAAAEQRTSQRIIISLGFLSLLGVMVFSALDNRFGWSPVPAWVSLLGEVLVALGLFIDLVVMRENTFSASNVRVEQGQTVISTGPYAIARHSDVCRRGGHGCRRAACTRFLAGAASTGPDHPGCWCCESWTKRSCSRTNCVDTASTC